MAKAITEKNSISIKGILNVDTADNTIIVEIEDGEARELADILHNYNGAEVAMTVASSIDLA